MEADDVDIVINTHVDGIGVNVLLDGSPTFPTARYLVPRAELDAMRAGTHRETRADALLALQDDGIVEPTEGGETVLPGVRLEDAPGHNPGMHVVWVEDGDAVRGRVGHLFLHPAQIANPEHRQRRPRPGRARGHPPGPAGPVRRRATRSSSVPCSPSLAAVRCAPTATPGAW